MIEINKQPPSDQTARLVLGVWFTILLPKWAKPGIIFVFLFFLASSLYLLNNEVIPPGAWLALTGLVLSLVVMLGYMPVMVSSALKKQKQFPSYHEEKKYCFYDDYMTFSSGGGQPVEIPFSKFTHIYVTKIAVLFTVNSKLLLWLPTSEIPVDQLAVIMTSIEKSGVKVSIL